MATTHLGKAMLRLPLICRPTVFRPPFSHQLVSSGHSRLLSHTSVPGLRNPESGLSFRRRRSDRRHLRSSARQQDVTSTASQVSKSPAIDVKPLRTEPASIQQYSPPAAGFLSTLPPSWIPYAELARLDKPAGTLYLFFPCLFSTLLAAPLALPMASPSTVVGTSLLFLTGALVMRGAGCTINDLWDRKLDPHVARTRLRPIARGDVIPFSGLVFAGAQLLTGLAVLVQFPAACLWYGIPSLLLVGTYPLAKRVTDYPQFVLGLTFSWGAIMGFPALGIDMLQNATALAAAACLYTSSVAWTILYDMIYAHMDIKDDAKVGIKSIALRHDKHTKQILSGLAITQISLLGAAGVAAGFGPVFFVGSCGGAALTLTTMIYRVDLKSVKSCWWWFVNGCWFTGGAIATGMGAEYLAQYTDAAVNSAATM